MTNLPPRWTHFLQRSSQLLKAAAKSMAETLLVTPSQALLMVSWSRLWPPSPSLTFIKKKFYGSRSGKYGGCSSCWTHWASNQSETTAAVCTGTLSQWKNHCWDNISGLFSLKFLQTKSWLICTCSSFCTWDSSLGTQHADFFTRPKSSYRIRQMVPRHTP